MTSACIIKDCDRVKAYSATGYCYMHEKRFRRHGDPLVTTYQERRGITCRARGCANESFAAQLCRMHYQRKRAYGDENVYIARTAEERFWKSVEKTDGCWRWIGVVAGKYGQISVNAARTPAHRYSYELHYGIAPGAYMVCHKCDNPICVRPDHLFLGTAQDNMRDMSQKGRHPKRLSSYRAKLKPEDVIFIRQSNEPCTTLAKVYRVDPNTIRYARTGKNWKHIRG